MHKTQITVALSLVTFSLLSGCGSDSSDTVQDEPPISVRHITASRQIDLPALQYAIKADDEKAYFSAVNLAQKACARKFGIDSAIPVASQPSVIETLSARRVGLVNVDEAERYGYAAAPSAGGDDSKANGWNPSVREAQVMTGSDSAGQAVGSDPETGKTIPKGGCSTQGFRDVRHGKPSPIEVPLIDDILSQSWELTKADSRAEVAEKKWATCMAKRGYNFKHRWDAGNSVAGANAETQLAMAKLDVHCATDTRYIDTWVAVDTAYQQRLISKNQSQLEASLNDQRAVMTRVKSTLKGGL